MEQVFFNVPLPYILHLTGSCPFSKCPWFCGRFNLAGSYFSKWAICRDNLAGQKSLGPLKISLEMAHKVHCNLPATKNNLPHFQIQRYINSYNVCGPLGTARVHTSEYICKTSVKQLHCLKIVSMCYFFLSSYTAIFKPTILFEPVFQLPAVRVMDMEQRRRH